MMPLTGSPTPSCFYCTNHIAAMRITKRGKGQALSQALLVSTTFHSSHAPLLTTYGHRFRSYEQEEKLVGALSHVPLCFLLLLWPSSSSGAEALPRAQPGVPAPSSCPPVGTQLLCLVAGKATNILVQLYLFYTSNLAHCRESEE